MWSVCPCRAWELLHREQLRGGSALWENTDGEEQLPRVSSPRSFAGFSQ